MLETKKNLQGKIVALRTTAGEEVIGKLTFENDQTLTLAKPIVVQLQMIQQGGAAISFAPFMLARDDDKEYTFYRSSLLGLPVVVRDDICANYIKATTGLDIPASGGASSIIKP